MDHITKDAPTEIEVTSEDGFTILVKREGEHHLLYLYAKKGDLPEKYKGAYTTFEAATKDINRFFSDRQREMLIELEEIAEKLKNKKEAEKSAKAKSSSS